VVDRLLHGDGDDDPPPGREQGQQQRRDDALAELRREPQPVRERRERAPLDLPAVDRRGRLAGRSSSSPACSAARSASARS
jgi:hypothetical protein